MTCPACNQDAPTIVRGLRAYCTACGTPRPLSTAAEAVNVAGQPQQVGGRVASGLGIAAVGIGTVAAIVMGFLVALLGGPPLFIVAPILLLTALVALPLFLGGRRLRRAGADRERSAQEQAVFALAARKRGVVTAREVAGALAVREEEADALLTAIAKRPDGRVTLELDDAGGLSYLFHDLVATSRVRVADAPWQPPVRVGNVGAPPQVIDAELIDEDVPARGEARRIVRSGAP